MYKETGQEVKRAFTLVEILVVIVLIGILAVFVAPKFLSQAGPAKQKVAKSQIAMLENSVLMFRENVGRYPEQSEGLQALVTAPAGETRWLGPYCKPSQLKDPWGNPLDYKRPGTKNQEFDIISYGEDGKPEGEGLNADIYND